MDTDTQDIDFNTAKDTTLCLIPKGTIAKVRMTIEPGGYNDPARNWIGGYATRNAQTETVYLKVKFTVIQGPYTPRWIRQKIGLYSKNNDNQWGEIGRSLIKEILNSANGLKTSDTSDHAQKLRKIPLGQLDGIQFLARIDIKQEKNGEINVINHAIAAEHKDYKAYMVQPALITGTYANNQQAPQQSPVRIVNAAWS